MGTYELKNDKLVVTFKTLGGELTSIKDQAGIEYLWQADPEFWAGQAPVLFPIVGSLAGNEQKLRNGKTTKMPRHGVIRKKEFIVEEQTQNSITFLIGSDEQTKEQFPFDFEVRIRYELDGCMIRNQYQVKNTGVEAMPYAIGGHPAFRCPLLEGEAYEDYNLVLGGDETADCLNVDPVTALIDPTKRVRYLDQTNTLTLRHELFEDDAIIFDDLKERSLSYIHKSTGKGIRIDFAQMPFIGIWSCFNDQKAGAPFVALEPWHGMSARTDEAVDGYFEDKIGVRILQPKEQQETEFSITIL